MDHEFHKTSRFVSSYKKTHFIFKVIIMTELIFKICGTDVHGKKFVIKTNTPQHYNIFKGNLWERVNNKWKLIKQY